jgi:hypothetical protein
MNNGRYELRTISSHFGQTVVGIYETMALALEGRDLIMRSQDLPVIIYDSITDEPASSLARKKQSNNE